MRESAAGVCLPRAGFLASVLFCWFTATVSILLPFIFSPNTKLRIVNCILLYKCVIKLSVHNLRVALSFSYSSNLRYYGILYSLSPKFSSRRPRLCTCLGLLHTQLRFDVRVSFPFFHARSHTQRVFLRVWSGTKRLVALALDLCCDVLCCDPLISDGKHCFLPQTHERTPLSFHLADSIQTWECSKDKTQACVLSHRIEYLCSSEMQQWVGESL